MKTESDFIEARYKNPSYQKPMASAQKRLRVKIDCSEPQLTDQSFKKSTDINNIMALYAKTGHLPHYGGSEPLYTDLTQFPDLNTAYDIAVKAQEAFQELPPIIRKAMDNNAANLESFLSDETNQPLLLQHGVLIKRDKPAPERNLTDHDIEALSGALKPQKKAD